MQGHLLHQTTFDRLIFPFLLLQIFKAIKELPAKVDRSFEDCAYNIRSTFVMPLITSVYVVVNIK